MGKMTAIDPTLELGQRPPTVGPVDGRELAMLAHDIRGALQGVIGGISQIDATLLPPELREQVDRVAAAAKTLACLVGAMVGDEPEPGTRAGHAVVDLPRFLRYLRRRFAGEARAKGLEFRVEAADDLPQGLAVALVPLGRIMGNLIGNAIKYADAGTVQLAVARAETGEVILRVDDDGPGLSAEVQDTAFRFGSRPVGSTKPGQGVGLHIVKALTDEIGAEIAIGNRPGGGMAAELRLPAAMVSAKPAVPAAPVPDLAGVRVLLAEDNPTNQMVATQMLRALNAEVTVSADGVEALERFEAGTFDLVVVDIEMPRLSGLDVIRAIRARGDARAAVPIVALTAYAMREHRDRIAEAGANGLISKPITSVEALGRGLAPYVPQPAPPAATGAASGGEAGGVIDLDTFELLCDAIGPDLPELLDKVIADLTAAGADLDRAREPLDGETIRSASHILISVAGALGATRLRDGARRLNAAVHVEALDGIADELNFCLREIDAAVAFARARRAATEGR
jgi:CheY-like chemotaxis protein